MNIANDIVDMWIGMNNKIGELQKELETQKQINQGLQQQINKKETNK